VAYFQKRCQYSTAQYAGTIRKLHITVFECSVVLRKILWRMLVDLLETVSKPDDICSKMKQFRGEKPSMNFTSYFFQQKKLPKGTVSYCNSHALPRQTNQYSKWGLFPNANFYCIFGQRYRKYWFEAHRQQIVAGGLQCLIPADLTVESNTKQIEPTTIEWSFWWNL